MSVAIAMTVAPRPNIPLVLSVDNIRRGGFKGPFYLAMEPGSDDIEGEDLVIHRHSNRRGIDANARFCWHWLYESTDDDFLMVVENDVRFCPSAFETLERLCRFSDHWGYATLFTPHPYAPWIYESPWVTPDAPEGWTDWRPGYNNSAGQCVCMPRWRVREMLDNLSFSPLDKFIGEWSVKSELPSWYAIPSMAEHIGNYSIRLEKEDTISLGLGYNDEA